jgi:cardiolipin synthase
MKLHRVANKPDWANTNKAKYNRWQAIAIATHSAVTPGNIVTVLGGILVLLGLVAMLQHSYWLAVVLLIVGRLCDIIDGWLAEQTDTKSPLGEILDASTDKIGTLLTIIALLLAHITTPWLLAALLLPQLIIVSITASAQFDHKKLHPSRIGKYSMAIAWCSLVGLVAAKAMHSSHTNIFSFVLYGFVIISIILGCIAAYGYTQELAAKSERLS